MLKIRNLLIDIAYFLARLGWQGDVIILNYNQEDLEPVDKIRTIQGKSYFHDDAKKDKSYTLWLIETVEPITIREITEKFPDTDCRIQCYQHRLWYED